MKSSDWRFQTLEQLRKDMRMSGVSLDDMAEVSNPEDPISFIAEIIHEVKDNKPLWDSLNYRVDLPIQLHLDSLNDEELARLYLLRSFQKVWLRQQFSSTSAKDDRDKTRKHLKP
ncbi:MAG: hypothetical protein HQ500_01075 [Flavobacteriales bacterium]|nr:hypothetical protein [Flavobacteriales bacterium]